MSGAIEEGVFEYWKLLKSVSRSFYLSMRFLPAAMREPISVAYLLARAADTIADTEGLDSAEKLKSLDSFQDWVCEGSDRSPSLDFGAYGDLLTHPGERLLLKEIDRIVTVLRGLDEVTHQLVRDVLAIIISGQKRDLEHSRVFCQNADELLLYTYQVAGCVGEFWTEVGFYNLGKKFADPDRKETMLASGKKLGQGLQLINILRDLHEDIPAGRVYLPADELAARGWDGKSGLSVDSVQPVAENWSRICSGFLSEGKAYVRGVRNFRARFATALPLFLAEATAEKLAQAGMAKVMRGKVKISRRKVWACMFRALLT